MSALLPFPADHDFPPELVAAVQVSLLDGVGPRLRKVLLERFGTPAGILAAAPSDLRSTPGIGPKLVQKIVASRTTADAVAELRICRENGVATLLETEPEYPRALKEIPDPPGVLYAKGTILPRDALAVAIVGTRHATPYGLQQAERLAAGLARAGLTIVSGLARGIDGAAHRGALAAGGRTLAVLGSGVLHIYPPEHGELARLVTEAGALLSEMPPYNQPLAGVFPQRNRIISGLSLGVIVVEAAQRSGALITARLAMEQNREVFAVPGRIDTPVARGCHQLIRDGARLVESVDDVLEHLGHLVEAVPQPDGKAIHHPAEVLLNEIERQVLDAIDTSATSLDDVVAATGLAVSQVLATVSALELRRLIRRVSGNLVVRL